MSWKVLELHFIEKNKIVGTVKALKNSRNQIDLLDDKGNIQGAYSMDIKRFARVMYQKYYSNRTKLDQDLLQNSHNCNGNTKYSAIYNPEIKRWLYFNGRETRVSKFGPNVLRRRMKKKIFKKN